MKSRKKYEVETIRSIRDVFYKYKNSPKFSVIRLPFEKRPVLYFGKKKTITKLKERLKREARKRGWGRVRF